MRTRARGPLVPSLDSKSSCGISSSLPGPLPVPPLHADFSMMASVASVPPFRPVPGLQQRSSLRSRTVYSCCCARMSYPLWGWPCSTHCSGKTSATPCHCCAGVVFSSVPSRSSSSEMAFACPMRSVLENDSAPASTACPFTFPHSRVQVLAPSPYQEAQQQQHVQHVKKVQEAEQSEAQHHQVEESPVCRTAPASPEKTSAIRHRSKNCASRITVSVPQSVAELPSAGVFSAAPLDEVIDAGPPPIAPTPQTAKGTTETAIPSAAADAAAYVSPVGVEQGAAEVLLATRCQVTPAFRSDVKKISVAASDGTVESGSERTTVITRKRCIPFLCELGPYMKAVAAAVAAVHSSESIVGTRTHTEGRESPPDASAKGNVTVTTAAAAERKGLAAAVETGTPASMGRAAAAELTALSDAAPAAILAADASKKTTSVAERVAAKRVAANVTLATATLTTRACLRNAQAETVDSIGKAKVEKEGKENIDETLTGGIRVFSKEDGVVDNTQLKRMSLPVQTHAVTATPEKAAVYLEKPHISNGVLGLFTKSRLSAQQPQAGKHCMAEEQEEQEEQEQRQQQRMHGVRTCLQFERFLTSSRKQQLQPQADQRGRLEASQVHQTQERKPQHLQNQQQQGEGQKQQQQPQQEDLTESRRSFSANDVFVRFSRRAAGPTTRKSTPDSNGELSITTESAAVVPHQDIGTHVATGYVASVCGPLRHSVNCCATTDPGPSSFPLICSCCSSGSTSPLCPTPLLSRRPFTVKRRTAASANRSRMCSSAVLLLLLVLLNVGSSFRSASPLSVADYDTFKAALAVFQRTPLSPFSDALHAADVLSLFQYHHLRCFTDVLLSSSCFFPLNSISTSYSFMLGADGAPSVVSSTSPFSFVFTTLKKRHVLHGGGGGSSYGLSAAKLASAAAAAAAIVLVNGYPFTGVAAATARGEEAAGPAEWTDVGEDDPSARTLTAIALGCLYTTFTWVLCFSALLQAMLALIALLFLLIIVSTSFYAALLLSPLLLVRPFLRVSLHITTQAAYYLVAGCCACVAACLTVAILSTLQQLLL